LRSEKWGSRPRNSIKRDSPGSTPTSVGWFWENEGDQNQKEKKDPLLRVKAIRRFPILEKEGDHVFTDHHRRKKKKERIGRLRSPQCRGGGILTGKDEHGRSSDCFWPSEQGAGWGKRKWAEGDIRDTFCSSIEGTWRGKGEHLEGLPSRRGIGKCHGMLAKNKKKAYVKVETREKGKALRQDGPRSCSCEETKHFAR